MPLLGPAGGNIVQPACPSDLVVFHICCLAQADKATTTDLVVAMQELLMTKGCFRRVKLTVRQSQLVQNFLPDLDGHDWPLIAWKLNLDVSQNEPTPRQRINPSSEDGIDVEMMQ